MCAYYSDITQEGFPNIQRSGRMFRELGVKVDDLEFRAGSPNAGGRQLSEMQDELRTYRMESRKKDDLIQKLCTLPGSEIAMSTTRHFDPRLAPLPSKTDSAHFQVKLDGMEEKLYRRDQDVQHRDERIAVLQGERGDKDAEIARLVTVLAQCRQEVNELTTYKETYEALKARNEYAVTALQDQYRASQDRVLDLETRIRTHLESRELVEVEKGSLDVKFRQLMGDISRLTTIEEGDDIIPVIAKLTEVVQERALFESRIATMTATLETRDAELLAAKETITQAIAEGNKDNVGYTSYSTVRVSYKAEAERLAATKDDLEAQVLLLEKRVEAGHRVTTSLREELAEATRMLSEVEADRREKAYGAESADKQFNALIECLAAIVGTALRPCEASEGSVKERVKTMAKDLKEQSAMCESLEQRSQALQRQFESQYVGNKGLEDRSRRYELEKMELEERVKIMESEMAARDILREGMRDDKERMCRQLQSIADIMGIEYATEDMDPEYIISLIQGRVQNNPPCTALVPRGSTNRHRGGCSTCPSGRHRASAGGGPQCPTVIQLNEQVANLREQLAAKDRQLDTLKRENALRSTENLRRPVVEVPVHCHVERACSPCRFAAVIETPRDQLSRLHDQLECSRIEIAALKEAIINSEDVQASAAADQENEIQSLSKNLEKMEKVRQRQAKKISSLREDVVKSESAEKLSKQLQNIKSAYTELARREKHGSEFRSALAHLLAVDLYMESNPDGEMLTRVNRLLQACQASGITLPTGPILPAYAQPVSQSPQMWPMGGSSMAPMVKEPPKNSSPSKGQTGSKSKTQSSNKGRDDRKY